MVVLASLPSAYGQGVCLPQVAVSSVVRASIRTGKDFCGSDSDAFREELETAASDNAVLGSGCTVLFIGGHVCRFRGRKRLQHAIQKSRSCSLIDTLALALSLSPCRENGHY